MKIILVLFGLLLTIVGAIAFSQTYLKDGKLPFAKSPTATINKTSFTLIIPKSPEIGLSDRSSLPENNGMIFVFDKADYHPFWMRNMKIPIDMIFINKDHIVTIYSNLQPPKSTEENVPLLRPDEPSDKVLEINAGLAEKYNFKKGDTVKIENL